jgi:hypothetical protein
MAAHSPKEYDKDYYYHEDPDFSTSCQDLYATIMDYQFFDLDFLMKMGDMYGNFISAYSLNAGSTEIAKTVLETKEQALERLSQHFGVTKENPLNFEMLHSIGNLYLHDPVLTSLRLNCWRAAVLERILHELRIRNFPNNILNKLVDLFLTNNTLRSIINMKMFLKILEEHKEEKRDDITSIALIMDKLDDMMRYIFCLIYAEETTNLEDEGGKYILIDEKKYYLDPLIEKFSTTNFDGMINKLSTWIKDCSFMDFISITELLGGGATKSARPDK